MTEKTNKKIETKQTMDGWTEVRYGRRAKHDRGYYRDRDYGWSDGRKESAPSFSFGRRDRFPFPNPLKSNRQDFSKRESVSVRTRKDLSPAKTGEAVVTNTKVKGEKDHLNSVNCKDTVRRDCSNVNNVATPAVPQNSSDHHFKLEEQSEVKVRHKWPAPLPLPALALFLKQHSTKSIITPSSWVTGSWSNEGGDAGRIRTVGMGGWRVLLPFPTGGGITFISLTLDLTAIWFCFIPHWEQFRSVPDSFI